MLLFSLILSLLLPYAHAETYYLGVGASMQYPVSRRSVVHITNGNLVRARDFGSFLSLVGLKNGYTEILSGKQKNDLVVLAKDEYRKYQMLSRVLRDKRGLRLKYQAGCFIIEGKLLRWKDWQDLAELFTTENLQKNCHDTYLMKAEIDAVLKKDTERFFQEIFSKNQLYPLDMKTEKGFTLYLPKMEDAKAKNDEMLYKKIFLPYGIEVIPTDSQLQILPNIETEILVTEVRKKEFQKLGIGYPDGVVVNAQTVDWSALPIELNLQAIEENGVGKILASPKLLTKSGSEATFLAGGEIPIRIVGYKKQDVLWKTYGIMLKILPTVDIHGKLSMQLTTEVSTIDDSQKVDGLPGFLTNRIQNQFHLKQSEAIVISGLIREDSGKSKEGLPYLQHIPILGALFSSEDYKNQKTELVVIVKPKIISNQNAQSTVSKN